MDNVNTSITLLYLTLKLLSQLRNQAVKFLDTVIYKAFDQDNMCRLTTKVYIVALHNDRLLCQFIASQVQCHHTIIVRTIKGQAEQNNLQSRSRSGFTGSFHKKNSFKNLLMQLPEPWPCLAVRTCASNSSH